MQHAFLPTANSDGGSRGLKGSRVQLSNVDIRPAGIQVGEIGSLSIGGDSEGSPTMVNVVSPVGRLDGVEGAVECQHIDMGFEVGLSKGSGGAQRRREHRKSERATHDGR